MYLTLIVDLFKARLPLVLGIAWMKEKKNTVAQRVNYETLNRLFEQLNPNLAESQSSTLLVLQTGDSHRIFFRNFKVYFLFSLSLSLSRSRSRSRSACVCACACA